MYQKSHKLMIRTVQILLALVALVVVVFLCGRWGWRLQGFRGCEGARIEAVTVEDGQVRLTGAHMGIPPEGFLGYLYDETQGQLHIGLRFDGFFGFFETGDFDITVPVEGPITEVYLVSGGEATLIWTQEEGLLTD